LRSASIEGFFAASCIEVIVADDVESAFVAVDHDEQSVLGDVGWRLP
jgi:hypothetical protein